MSPPPPSPPPPSPRHGRRRWRRGAVPVSGGQWLFGPDGLAGGGVAGAPALGELGDQQQAAAALVEGRGPGAGAGRCCCRRRPRRSGVRSRISRSWIGRVAVADGVGDQFADDQLGGERRPPSSPHAASCSVATSARAPATAAGIGGHVPGGDLARASRARVRATQQGDVVGRRRSGSRALEHRRRRSPPASPAGLRQRAAQQSPCPSSMSRSAGLDQAVGVEGEQAALGQLQLGGLEGQAAEAERRPGGQVEEPARCRPGVTRAGGGWPGAWPGCSGRRPGRRRRTGRWRRPDPTLRRPPRASALVPGRAG